VKADTRQDYRERILRVLDFIQQNLDAQLSLDTLASLACFSPYHFHRIFRGMVGESIRSHVRRIRLERAARRLLDTDDRVIAVALAAGFESHAAFTRAFRSFVGCSPSQFRRRPTSMPAALSGIHFRADSSLESFHAIDSGGSSMDVKIEQMEPQRVAYVHHVGPYRECGKAWEKVCLHLGPQGLLAGATFIGLSYDDPEVTQPEQLRYDACVTVDDDYQPDGDAASEIKVQTVPGGTYAVTTHQGPYDHLSDTYARLCGQWLPASGRRAREQPCFEVYLNDPEGTEPDELLTDIYLPLED